MSGEHVLTILRIEEGGYITFGLECQHPAVDTDEGAGWRCTNHPDRDEELTAEELIDFGCWLQTWWGELGQGMLEDIDPPLVWPLPVKPSDKWNYIDGGNLVADRDAFPEVSP